MLFRFYFHTIVGLINIIAILCLGDLGTVTFVLLAFLPLFMRLKGLNKMDEREYQIFYKVGNYSIIVIVLAVLLISKFSDYSLANNNVIGDYWSYLIIASLIFGQGFVGVITYYTES